MNRHYVQVLGALLLCTAPLAAQNPPAGAAARPAAADTSKKESDFVKLVKGTYKYVCDPHASIMKGSFTVS